MFLRDVLFIRPPIQRSILGDSFFRKLYCIREAIQWDRSVTYCIHGLDIFYFNLILVIKFVNVLQVSE